MMLGAVVADLAARITAAGIPAATDPRNFHPPAVLVIPDRCEPRSTTLARVTVRILIASAGPGHGDAVQWLDRALGVVWQVVGRYPAQLTAIDSPATGAPLLAYEVTFTTDTEIGDPP